MPQTYEGIVKRFGKYGEAEIILVKGQGYVLVDEEQ